MQRWLSAAARLETGRSPAISKPHHIAIIGGSLGGLFAAAILLRRGFNVHVYERNSTELSGRGAGIVTHDALRAALQVAGIDPSAGLGIGVAKRRTYARDGSLIGELDFPQVNTSWDQLLHALRAVVPDERYHRGKSLVRVAQDGDGVTAFFADGTEVRTAFLIAADGIRSTVRAQLSPEAVPQYAGYIAWRGLVDETALSPAAHDVLMHHFTFCLPPGEQMLAYPVAGPGNALEVGRRRCNLVWYRPASAAQALPRLLTDDSGKLHDGGIPPPLIAKAVKAEMLDAAKRLLAPAYVEAMQRSPMPLVQPIYDVTVTRMVFDRIVLMGDAAFVARPHVGAGVTKAAWDAVALADALSGATTLAQFEAARLAEGHRIIARARDLGAYMQADDGTGAPPAASRFSTPDAIMRETASLDF